MLKRLLISALAVSLFISAGAFGQSMHGHHQGGGEKINYDSLFKAATSLKDSPEGQQLVLDCVAKYGGPEHLEKLKSFHLTYEMTALMMNRSITVDKYFERNRRYKIVRHQDPIPEIRIINGAESWFIGRDTTIEFFSGKYKAELFSYLTLTMPLGITTERFDVVRYGTRSDDSLGYIYMFKHDSLLVIAGIDPVDHTIKKSEGVIYQEDQTFAFVNHFDDFREVEGYLFPHTLKNISIGLEVANSKLLDIKINPEFPAGTFTPKSALTPEKSD